MPTRSKHGRTSNTPITCVDLPQDHDDAPPFPIPMPPTQISPSTQHTRPASGLTRTIPTTSKRFAPAPSPAVPIVDLGTASVEHRTEGEDVLWGRWDRVSWSDAPTTRLLFVAYPSVLRIWDTTNLQNVEEVLRLRLASLDVGFGGAKEIRMLHAAVLPTERRREEEDRPWIGIVLNTGTFIIYSLTTHRVVTRFQVNPPTIHSFEASNQFIIISITDPPAIHVLSATTFMLLIEMPRSHLVLYTPPYPPVSVSAAGMHASATAVLTSAFAGALGSFQHSTGGDTTTSDFNLDAKDNEDYGALEPPRPIYALSRRLLAYASTAPRSTRQGLQVGVGMTESQSPATTAAAAAQSVWEGVRTLGGLAVSAARARMRRGAGAGAGADAGVGTIFSRSAPESGAGGERGRETEKECEGEGEGEGEGVYVVIVDLEPLLRREHCDGTREGDVVAEFRVDDARGVSKLAFGRDGCTLSVVGRDGTRAGVYNLRPCPRGLGVGEVWSVYDLRRGRTGAVVEAVESSADGRWLALATRKRTVHVFAVNPYGGRADVRSHWEERVRDRNGGELQSMAMPCEAGPLVRLRAGAVGGSKTQAPLAFMFVEQGGADAGIPNHLLPPTSPSPAFSTSVSTSTSPTRASPHTYAPRSFSSQRHSDAGGSGSGTSPPLPAQAETQTRKRGGYQDLLLFDPAEVVVVLRRVGLEARIRQPGMGMGISLPSVEGMMSVSLPGAGFAASGAGSAGRHRGSQYIHQHHHQHQHSKEVQMELGARESVVMTWSLRAWGAGEGTKVVQPPRRERERERIGGRADWLAQAELSTCSTSSKILPRSVYLSHQFGFYTLGEDYHALIRRYQLDIAGAKIDVRREVQVSAGGGGESFVEGFSFASPRDIHPYHHHHSHHSNHIPHHHQQRTLSASFDEPLACALTNELEHPRIAGVLPMLPNGTPGARRRGAAVAAAIPIRTIGDGMSEGLGRLRRGIERVRSPKMHAWSGSGSGSGCGAGIDEEGVSVSVPLEFDEEDEDFVGAAELGVGSGVVVRVGGGGIDADVDTASTPATSEDDWERRLETREDMWGGWSESDRGAVEEVERFCDVNVVGLLDEEQMQERRDMEKELERRGGGGGGEGKGNRNRKRGKGNRK